MSTSSTSSSPSSPSGLRDSLTLTQTSSSQTSPATSVPNSPDLKAKDVREHSSSAFGGFPKSLPPVPKSKVWDSMDDKDAGTPDAWLNRDPRLVRLTGKVGPFPS